MSRNHVHRYKRVDLSANKDKPYIVLKCSLPDCSHYVPEKMAEGRECICNFCENRFVLTKKNMMRSKPHCGCKTRKEVDIGVIDLVRRMMEGSKDAVRPSENSEDSKGNGHQTD